MQTTVTLIDCPECGGELHGRDYAYCPACNWMDYDAAAAADKAHYEMTWGAI